MGEADIRTTETTFFGRWKWVMLLLATIVIIALVPMPDWVDHTHNLDKVGHVCYFTAISLLLVRNLKPLRVFIIGLCFAIAIELVQELVPWRTSSVIDAIFSTSGTLLALIVYSIRPLRNLLEYKLW